MIDLRAMADPECTQTRAGRETATAPQSGVTASAATSYFYLEIPVTDDGTCVKEMYQRKRTR